VGPTFALAVLNRVVDPCSKLAFETWWAKTAGERWLGLPPGALDHRRFWDAMDAISESRLEEIERRIVEAMVATFEVDCSGLVLDMTNFATYIDSANPRAPIAQRGHAKQKRNDASIGRPGLVVSTDAGVPLVSHAYPGNKPDVTQFPTLVGELVSRFRPFLAPKEASSPLSSTPGQNSNDNYKLLDGLPLHFVGSLPPSDHPELLSAAKDRYQILDEETFPTSVHSSPERWPSAPGGVWLSATQRACTPTVPGLRPDLGQGPPPARRGPSPPRSWQHPQTKREVEAEIGRDPGPSVLVESHLDHADWNRARRAASRVLHQRQSQSSSRRRMFGKRILFTDHDDWSTKEVVSPTAPRRRSRRTFAR